jgi:hypothetical protein
MKLRYGISALRALALLLATSFSLPALAEVTLMHVHGLAYSADGKKLMIPIHHGLAIYEAGKWSKAPGPEHDYMGFSATRDRLYSSGHPARESGLVNPFGVIRSKDGGKTWDKLSLEGETDFHLLATGWNTSAIYVWNPAPSSRMKRPGLHYTLNDGLIWRPAAAAGLRGDPHAIAVHPNDTSMSAVATSEGVFISRDHGEKFEAVMSKLQGLALHFDLDGKHLWVGAFDGAPRLARIVIGATSVEQFVLPPLARDAVAYIAQHPVSKDEYAIATFGRSVYLSRDGARSWVSIADRGQGK